ncbi:MAG TPA: cytidine deaminase [Chthonomonadaceae bacterium]|nr:cytidine deaminase [Chthonomonadaceae bacterium]
MSAPSAEEAALLARAREAALAAYCPYSNFPVGAAVETERGVFRGCNVENASFGLTVCAERVALFSAVAAGARRISRLAVSCLKPGPDAPPAGRMPCGACRQVIAEFMPPDAIVLVDGAGAWRVADLLPEPYRLTDNQE